MTLAIRILELCPFEHLDLAVGSQVSDCCPLGHLFCDKFSARTVEHSYLFSKVSVGG